MEKHSYKKPNEVEKPSHNRLRVERIESNDPKAIARQNRYYENQQHILEKKRQYRQEVKDGKRVVIPKKTKGKELTEEQKRELRLRQKRNHYKRNAEDILEYQANHRKKKLQEKKIQEAKNAIDAFNKLNGW